MLDHAVFSASVARDLAFARPVVWECLVDETLLGAWLGEATLEDREGGVVALLPRTGQGSGRIHLGTVVRLAPHSAMVWAFDDGTVFAFALTSRASDPLAEAVSRDAHGATRLTVDCSAPGGSDVLPALSETWSARLDALASLLSGRPPEGGCEAGAAPGAPR